MKKAEWERMSGVAPTSLVLLNFGRVSIKVTLISYRILNNRAYY